MPDEWISIEDRLPDDDITVLAWGRTMYAKYASYYIAYHEGNRWLTQERQLLLDVSHWCDLLAPPTE